jgi:hypothetical protein
LKFSNAIQTALRLLIVGLLIYPFPIAVAVEQTVNEGFEDSTYETGLTISGGNSDAYIYCSEQGNYNTSGCSLAIASGTYVFEFSEDVYEVGFIVGAVNNSYDVKYYYSDGTDETIQKSGQSNAEGPPWPNMYDSFYKSFTDYNNDEANTDKFITKFEVTVSDISVLDTLYWQYDDGLTQGIGAPTNLATTQNLHSGAVGVTWTAPTGYTNTPERYAVAFSNDNFQTTNYAVATSTNSGDTSYTFSKSYLTSIFTDLEVGDTLYFKVRSDDDTNSLYSSWTDVVTYTIPDVASGVSTLTANQDNQYQGVTFYWTQPNTGWATQTSYKLAYKDSDDTEFTYVTGISADATNYTWTGVLEDTYEFLIYACTQNDSWCHGPQNGSITTTIVSTTPTTTIVYTLGPPMNTEASNVYDSGVRVKWDAPNTGNATADTYELYYRTSPTDEVVVYNISNTEYTIPYANIPNGTYEFSVRAYDSVNNVYSAYSTEPTLEVFNQKAKDDADAEAERERKRREYEAEQARLQAIEDEKKANYNETGYYETDAERSSREQKEYEEEQARIAAEKDKNFAETGYYELDSERADREQREYEEEQARLKAIEDALQAERDKNFLETGISETNEERAAREAEELAAEQARIEEEIKNAFKTDDTGGGEPLTKEEEKELEELINVIIELEETLEVIEIEEEVFELPEKIIVVTTTTTTIPDIVEDIDIEDDIPEQVEDKPLPSEEGDSEVQLTREEVEELVTEVEEAITEVVEVEEIFEDVEIIEEEELETLSEEEVQAYEEKVEEAATLAVQQLETEEKVEVVKEVAKVKVQNLATADTTTKAVVKAVVKEVTKVETVAELDEEEKQAVGEVLGFEEETAAEDVEIIAEQAVKEEAVAEAVEEYVDRAIENQDVEDYTLADVVTEVQVEIFLENPVGSLLDVNIEELDLSSIGSDMTSDQKEKAQEVVVPVILASQIIAQAGAVLRRF